MVSASRTDPRPEIRGHEGRNNVDPQNLQTVAQQYFDSVKDRRNRRMVTAKYTNLAEASRADIEQDVCVWFAGFTSGIKLVGSKPTLPPLESVLEVVMKSFETEIAA
jgi:hypothetical protein